MSYFIDPDARTVEQFDISKFMEFTEGDYDPLGSYMLREVRKLRTVGFHVVRRNPGRPDLMAYDIYGDPQYWWLLMEYNGYVSWEDVRLNRRVRYFSLADLNTLYLSLAALQRRRDRG